MRECPNGHEFREPKRLRFGWRERRIKALEEALAPVANHLVVDKDNEFIGGLYAIDVVQTAKKLLTPSQRVSKHE